MALPAPVTYCPAVQVRHALQLAASAASLYSPSAHAVHTWSLVAVPAVLTYSPATHPVYAVQLTALLPTLYVPAPHAVQLRSVVAPPSADTYVPAEHAVRATHAVAGLPSWSHVPSPSSHAAVFGVWVQPTPGSQASSVQG